MSTSVARARETVTYSVGKVPYDGIVEYVYDNNNVILTLENGERVSISQEEFDSGFEPMNENILDLTIGQVGLVQTKVDEPVVLGMVVEKKWWKLIILDYSDYTVGVAREGTVILTNSYTYEIDASKLISLTELSSDQVTKFFSKGGFFFGDTVRFEPFRGAVTTGTVVGWSYYQSYGPTTISLEIITPDEKLPQSCTPDRVELVVKGPAHLYYS